MSTILDPLAVFLNVASDPTDYMAFTTAAALQPVDEMDGRISTLANGRERMIVRAGERQAVDLPFTDCTREQTDWLRSHKGVLLCFRDHVGRKFYGTYFAVQVAEDVWPGTDHTNATVSFREVTHSEAVA